MKNLVNYVFKIFPHFGFASFRKKVLCIGALRVCVVSGSLVVRVLRLRDACATGVPGAVHARSMPV